MPLSEADRVLIRQLLTDLPELWQAETTTQAERKRLLRCMICDVTLDGVSEPGQILTHIRWQTGARCILIRRVVAARTGTMVQEMAHESVQAQCCFSDGLDVYQTALYWPAVHYPMDDNSETFSVESTNAELRLYLARLGRRFCCFC